MRYKLEFKPKSVKDLKKIPKDDAKRILSKIEDITDDLSGDIKKVDKLYS